MTIPLALFLAHAPALGSGGAEAELVAAYAERAPRTDWLFMLETAGEAKAAADASLVDIASFVEAVPAGDSVEIIAWHTRPSVALPATRVEDAGRTELVARIRKLELASAKERDLGAALAAAAANLDRADAGAVQYLFLMSNFCHNPTFASDWDSGGRGCRAIRGLARITTGLATDRGDHLLITTVFPIATPSSPVHQPGLEAARTVFAPVGEFRVADAPLGAWLTEHRDHVASTRIRPLAEAEVGRFGLAAAVERAPTPDSQRATLRLTTGLTDLGLRLDDLVVEGATLVGPASRELTPDAVIEVDVSAADIPFSLVPRNEILDFDVVVRANGTLLPDRGLAAAGLAPARPGLEARALVTMTRSYGLSLPMALLLFGGGGSVTIFGGVWLSGRLAPRRLGGAFVYRRANGPRRVLDISELDEAPIVIRAEGDLGVGRTQDAVLVLRMVRPFLRTHAQVEIRKEAGVEINTRKVPPGRHRIVAGATSFQFGDYRLTWE